jgi:PDZ domain
MATTKRIFLVVLSLVLLAIPATAHADTIDQVTTDAISVVASWIQLMVGDTCKSVVTAAGNGPVDDAVGLTAADVLRDFPTDGDFVVMGLWAGTRLVWLAAKIGVYALAFAPSDEVSPVVPPPAPEPRLTAAFDGSRPELPHQRGALRVLLAADPNGAGVDISEVSPGGPAERSGLMPGDDLLAVDGIPLSGLQQAIRTIGAFGAGRRVLLFVQRRDRQFNVYATLGAALSP